MIEVYVIAYNNLFCVEYQIKTFKAFCKDDYKLIIVDSNCGEHIDNSIKKKEICDSNGVEFISLPNELSLKGNDPSIILGRKLNYVYYEIIKKRNPKYFAFIDQDFFPFKDFSVKEILDEYGIYGDVIEGSKKSENINNLNNDPWAIHPWLSFYRLDFLDGYQMDWMPCFPEFDTGGANWYSFFSKKGISKKDYWIRDNMVMHFPWKEISNSGPVGYEDHYFNWSGMNIYGQVQIYDNKFIHMLNSKFLDDPMNPKTNWCKGFLDAALLNKNLL